MVENNPQPFGTDSETFQEEYYDNSSQRLERHIYINNRGEYDHDVADFIFKKAGYTRTYIAIHTTGIPDGVILNLCDENSNQLYSPVDTNKNWTTTACSIIVGETDIIPLPAQFNNQLSNHVPFPVGTYNWKLVFAGNDYYEGKELPLNVEIRDFKVWDIQTPTIYPNENVKVKIQTNANTLYPPTYDMSFLLTNNATYNYETGIITYPNQDITDLNIGKHMQVINPSNNCFINYEVKNPIQFERNSFNNENEYLPSPNYHQIGATIAQDCTLKMISIDSISINGNTNLTTETSTSDTRIVYNISGSKMPPGVYHCFCTATLSNGNLYSCENTFTITTEDCSLTLIDNNNQLQSTYLYNNTPIPNAKLGLINTSTNTLVETQITDSNGQVNWNINTLGGYVCVAIDYDNTHILSSDTCYLESIGIDDLLLGTTLVNNITATDGEIIYDSFTVDSNTTMNDLNNVLTNITHSNGYLNVTAYTTNETRNYFVNQTEAEIINDFITNINCSDGMITYTQFSDNDE